MSNWTHVSSRLGTVKEETRSIAKEIYDVARANGHDIWFMWGMGPSREHSSGLALDFMVRNRAGGDFVRNYIWANRARLRTRHVIWWQRITSTVVRPGEVRLMADRGDVTQNHYDHVHVWFYPGKYQAPEKTPTEQSGDLGIVKNVQTAVKTTVDGKWGPVTDRRVLQMRSALRQRVGWPINATGSFDIRLVQSIVETPVDGVWGPNSQGALLEWAKKFQKTLNVRVDGKWGPVSDGKLLLVRRRHLGNY